MLLLWKQDSIDKMSNLVLLSEYLKTEWHQCLYQYRWNIGARAIHHLMVYFLDFHHLDLIWTVYNLSQIFPL